MDNIFEPTINNVDCLLYLKRVGFEEKNNIFENVVTSLTFKRTAKVIVDTKKYCVCVYLSNMNNTETYQNEPVINENIDKSCFSNIQNIRAWYGDLCERIQLEMIGGTKR